MPFELADSAMVSVAPPLVEDEYVVVLDELDWTYTAPAVVLGEFHMPLTPIP